MCNCNQNRSTVSAESKDFIQGNIKVRLIKDHPIYIHGSYTGRLYRFNTINDIILVDSRDVNALDGLFFQAV
jgi:hypothetical protein